MGKGIIKIQKSSPTSSLFNQVFHHISKTEKQGKHI